MVVASEAVAAEGGKALIIINRTLWFFPYGESRLYWYWWWNDWEIKTLFGTGIAAFYGSCFVPSKNKSHNYLLRTLASLCKVCLSKQYCFKSKRTRSVWCKWLSKWSSRCSRLRLGGFWRIICSWEIWIEKKKENDFHVFFFFYCFSLIHKDENNCDDDWYR